MNIAVLGYGVVGKGCVEALEKTEIKVKRILDIRSNPAIDLIRTTDFNDIIKDKSIDLVAEMMGGENPAYEYIKAALEAGKHAVTSNKQMLSLHYGELTSIAAEKGVKLLFSACVGGGIPWIRNLKRVASIDDISEIGGVMNGTSNFILNTLMSSYNFSKDDLNKENYNKDYDKNCFNEAVKQAQNLGYAEKDPTADIMGYDVRAKLAISCNVAFKTNLDPYSIPTAGIADITRKEILEAKSKGMTIRLLATAKKKENGEIEAAVAPSLVEQDNPAYNLPGPKNIFWLKGKQSGVISFSGMGAGGAPTGINVAEDIMEAFGL